MYPTSRAYKLSRLAICASRKLIQERRHFAYRKLSAAQAQGKPALYLPLYTVGSAAIQFSGHVKFSDFPASSSFGSCTYAEARNDTAKTVIGIYTLMNNRINVIFEFILIKVERSVQKGETLRRGAVLANNSSVK